MQSGAKSAASEREIAMTDIKKVEQTIKDDAKAVLAETESAISQLIGFLTPRWDKFSSAWATWTMRKKLVFVSVASLAAVGVYEFVPSPMHLLGARLGFCGFCCAIPLARHTRYSVGLRSI